MRKPLCLLLLILVSIGTAALSDEFRYEPDWESIRGRYRCPEWFRDAKFGVFVFWGPASVPAVSTDKYGAWMYTKGYFPAGVHVWKYHQLHFGHQSEFGYKDFFPRFKMERFDAEAWASLFAESGARYIVPVAEMHDGYAMYASRHTRWNVVDVGPERDVMRELVDAARRRGLKVGVSSHYALNRQFYPKWDPSFDTNDPEYADLYWKPIEKDSHPSKEFLDHWWDRTTDMVDQYEPDLLWFDFGLDKPGFEPVHKRVLAHYYNKGLEWGKEVVFQNKNFDHESFPEDLIVLDIERGRMSGINPNPWQTDTAVGKVSWTHVVNENYKSSDRLIDELCDIVSKNGCLLLSVGPKADGTIGSDETAILRDFGVWLRVNGEAIYDTRPWKVFGEGPTEVDTGHHTEYDDVDSVAEDIRFTTKEGALYAIALAWPEGGVFRVRSLATGNPHDERPIASVELLSGPNRIAWRQTDEALVVEAHGDPPGQAAYAFRIRFAD